MFIIGWFSIIDIIIMIIPLIAFAAALAVKYIQDSAKGGAVETGCSDLYDDIY